MKTNWFAERRLDYIDFRLAVAGHIRRADIMDTFGVSMPQASADLNRFIAIYPKAMAYDKTAKRYAARKGFKSRRGHNLGVVMILAALHSAGHPLGWS